MLMITAGDADPRGSEWDLGWVVGKDGCDPPGCGWEGRSRAVWAAGVCVRGEDWGEQRPAREVAGAFPVTCALGRWGGRCSPWPRAAGHERCGRAIERCMESGRAGGEKKE